MCEEDCSSLKRVGCLTLNRDTDTMIDRALHIMFGVGEREAMKCRVLTYYIDTDIV